MSALRMEKINNEIQKALSTIIQTKVKNPNLVSMVSIMNVDTTSDLKICKIKLSIFDLNKENVKKTFDAVLQSASFIRKELAHTVMLRQVPELKFMLSDDLEYSLKISKIIDTLDIKKDE